MAGAFQIETANWHDLNALRQIEKECFGADAWPLWDLIAVLTFSNVIRLKAVVDGHMVGFVGGDPKPNDGVGWITTLGVLPAYRQQGIAKALLATCEEQMGLPRIKLSVRRSNEAAIHLYQQAGYHRSGVWPRYYAGGEDALVLEKDRVIVQGK